MISMRRVFLLMFLASAISGCGTAQMPRSQVERLVEDVVATKLPPQASDVHASDAALFTRVTRVCFRCTEPELQAFLQASPRLKHELEAELRALQDSMCTESWWHPDALHSVRGARHTWKDAPYTIDSYLMTGQDGKPGVVVYLMVVSEKRAEASH